MVTVCPLPCGQSGCILPYGALVHSPVNRDDRGHRGVLQRPMSFVEVQECYGGPGGVLWRAERNTDRAMLRGVLFAQELTGIFCSAGNCFPLFRSLSRDCPLWIMM